MREDLLMRMAEPQKLFCAFVLSLKAMYPSDVFSRLYPEEGGALLYPKTEGEAPGDASDALDTNIFNVMLARRSQRKFADRLIEEWKLEMILAAADTAPTAGGFQGFEIFNVKSPEVKAKLVIAANRQPYVDAPLVLVFCMNPNRIKMNYPAEIIRKFSLQDATLAAAYAQLGAHAVGLSSVWIGMIDEKKVMDAIGTGLTPSSLLCIGYPVRILQPKPKRNLLDLTHEI
jgi:nitroreductase